MSSPFTSDKMFRYPDRLALGLAPTGTSAPPPPVTVELDLTNTCGHACPGCTFSYLVNVDKSSIPYDLAADVIGQLADLGVKAVTFSGGGEPLNYGANRVLALMALCRAEGMETALITNGSLLRDERFLELCAWVRVSLDAYDADTFRRFHGRGEKEFDKVVGNVRRMAGAARKRKAEGLPCATLGVGFLTDRESVTRGDFLGMAAFCSDIVGLDYLQFRPLVENMVANPALDGGYAGFTPDDLADLRRVYRMAERGFSRPDFRVLWSQDKYEALAQPDFARTYHRCFGHFLQATICADATVSICCHGSGVDAYRLGDLKKNTFAEVWHGEQARQVRESIDPVKQCPVACRLHPNNVILEGLLRPGLHDRFI